jgi:beta-N-acetylhexosaminidase
MKLTKAHHPPATSHQPLSSLRDTIGRLLVVGIPGPELDAATRDALEELRVGGVILFKRNVETPSQIRALTRALHRLRSRPLISIDQEGGRVCRLSAPFTELPAAAVVGRSGDVGLARRIGEAIGRELSSVGIDIDYVPVLDVHSNPDNPVIGDRSFASDPATVARFGVAMMRGLQAGGVIPCGKHFPGHGDTSTDSHLELPVVSRSRAGLERIELAPFRAAIAAGIPMLMTAHVVYPALDKKRAATVSPAIIDRLLRQRMGFRGVVAGDDLHMRAISGKQSIAAAATDSIAAGVDQLLVCHDLIEAGKVVAAISEAIRNGSLESAKVEKAGQRILNLMKRHTRRRPKTCRIPNARHTRLVQDLLASRA